uniref:Uncharacterized protein n=1 Tax=Knipowitschia caucasica TaxID=637954 RepID=A0AAV2JFA9_KNICA
MCSEKARRGSTDHRGAGGWATQQAQIFLGAPYGSISLRPPHAHQVPQPPSWPARSAQGVQRHRDPQQCQAPRANTPARHQAPRRAPPAPEQEDAAP